MYNRIRSCKFSLLYFIVDLRIVGTFVWDVAMCLSSVPDLHEGHKAYVWAKLLPLSSLEHL